VYNAGTGFVSCSTVLVLGVTLERLDSPAICRGDMAQGMEEMSRESKLNISEYNWQRT
jgi:hypothetical protein